MLKPEAEPTATTPGELGIGALALRIVDDAKRWARAELGFYKDLASDRASDAGVSIALGVAILMLAQALLVVLLVGSVLTLSPSIGAGWATLLVAAITLLVIAVLAAVARGKLRRAARPIPKGAA